MANDETDTLISDCENRSEKLSDWECDFIDSIRRQYDSKGSLSERQQEILSKIWEKVT